VELSFPTGSSSSPSPAGATHPSINLSYKEFNAKGGGVRGRRVDRRSGGGKYTTKNRYELHNQGGEDDVRSLLMRWWEILLDLSIIQQQPFSSPTTTVVPTHTAPQPQIRPCGWGIKYIQDQTRNRKRRKRLAMLCYAAHPRRACSAIPTYPRVEPETPGKLNECFLFVYVWCSLRSKRFVFSACDSHDQSPSFSFLFSIRHPIRQRQRRHRIRGDLTALATPIHSRWNWIGRSWGLLLLRRHVSGSVDIVP